MEKRHALVLISLFLIMPFILGAVPTSHVEKDVYEKTGFEEMASAE